MTKIQRHSIVTLHHRLGLTDGTVLEDSFEQEPMVFHLGSGELAEGLELALLDLQEGDEQTIDIGPDLAFGFADETAVHSLQRSEFAPDCELQPGLIMEFSVPNGDSLPGTILDFDDATVKVDFNHPLAGQTVRFSVKIIKVENPPEPEIH
ncbi:MAG: FKBP-type peptidyl-prolyl cis-trans isomerase [Gammaproteobacteria bacterium]|nr:FKBP-type peptidyl-prolyl cis-trans isomerase [Gammaproteobacteria bacterium]